MADDWHVVPAVQQLSVFPHPSEWPQPASPKSAQVFGTHATHALLVQTSPVPQGEHALLVPHPRLMLAHPVFPASSTSAQVCGSQQSPL